MHTIERRTRAEDHDYSEALTNIAVDEFPIGLNEADAMPKIRKKTKLHLLGRSYGEAGALL
ncbi:MAG TPA: hypothetical protein VES62_08140 [Thermoleophilaceae bacterium]|nr:hypothetical protein [Thermoleophilaceae bacterium]